MQRFLPFKSSFFFADEEMWEPNRKGSLWGYSYISRDQKHWPKPSEYLLISLSEHSEYVLSEYLKVVLLLFSEYYKHPEQVFSLEHLTLLWISTEYSLRKNLLKIRENFFFEYLTFFCMDVPWTQPRTIWTSRASFSIGYLALLCISWFHSENSHKTI